MSLAVSILLAALSPAAFSQSNSDIETIRAQIEALRAEQARIAEMQRQTDAKIQSAGSESRPQRCVISILKREFNVG